MDKLNVHTTFRDRNKIPKNKLEVLYYYNSIIVLSIQSMQLRTLQLKISYLV